MTLPRGVLVAGPNLAVDRTIATDEFHAGTPTISDVVVTPGGKGVNVARALGVLGASATLVALLPGHMGEAVRGMLEEEGIDVVGVPVAGEARFAYIVLERDGRATVLNEPGPELDAAEWRAYASLVVRAMERHAVVVCSGSLPPGAPTDAYARITADAHDRGRPVIVDVSGPALEAAVSAGVDVVCPNLAEAEQLILGSAEEAVDAPVDARQRALHSAQQLVERGARSAIVTAAAAGAALAERGRSIWLQAPAVAVANPMGAGDAFVAGLAAALSDGESLRDSAVRAIATGSASVEHSRAGMLDVGRSAELERLVVEPA